MAVFCCCGKKSPNSFLPSLLKNLMISLLL
jgi:hypothetical protein